MAPIMKILIQILPTFSSDSKLPEHAKSAVYQPFTEETYEHVIQRPLSPPHPVKNHGDVMDSTSFGLSAVSWGKDRLDVFSSSSGNLTHKYWDGSQWNPSSDSLETLANWPAQDIVTTTWGTNRLDIFGIDTQGKINHQYYDGSAWQPSLSKPETLGGDCAAGLASTAVTWGKDRLDVFCTGPKGDLLHQYYDGSQWQPSDSSLESLGGSLSSAPSALTWGVNRLDIFGLNEDGEVCHLYWDGSQWSQWETFAEGSPGFEDSKTPLTVTTWGENRLDVFGVDAQQRLAHLFWDGSQWSQWETLGSEIQGKVAVSSWSTNRIDIIALHDEEKTYRYKYWDGSMWMPSPEAWYEKGSNFRFATNPTAVSWGENRLDILGISEGDSHLQHQAWTGYDWYPGPAEWEVLGKL